MNKALSVELFCICFSFLALFSCKDPSSFCDREGEILDLLGSEGCRIVIRDVESSSFFEATNINAFGILFYDGQRINYSYRISPSHTSCLQAIAIELLCVSEK